MPRVDRHAHSYLCHLHAAHPTSASEARALDPLAARRGDPDAGLRRDYFEKVHAGLNGPNLTQAVEATAGFPFALLEECYILTSKTARSAQRSPTAEDLAASAAVLRRSYRLAEGKRCAAGFAA